jgi:hypothetical protein
MKLGEDEREYLRALVEGAVTPMGAIPDNKRTTNDVPTDAGAMQDAA